MPQAVLTAGQLDRHTARAVGLAFGLTDKRGAVIANVQARDRKLARGGEDGTQTM